MPTTRNFQYDPITSSSQEIFDNGDTSPVDLRAITNNQYWLNNFYLHGPEDFGPALRLGQNGPIKYSLITEDRGQQWLDVYSMLSTRQVNGPGARRSTYALSGDLSVLDAEQNNYTFSVPLANITGYGVRLLTYTDSDGISHYEPVVEGSEKYNELVQQYPTSARWATPTEAAARAITSYLLQNHEKDIKDILDKGLDGNKQPQRNTVSSMAWMIAELNTSNLQFGKGIKVPIHA